MVKLTVVATALVAIALVVGVSGTFLTFSLQASVNELRSGVAGVSDRVGGLFQALGLTSAEQAKLVADARKEGALLVYGTIEESIMNAALGAFETLYGVKVEYWRASSSSVFDRVLAEVKAGNPRFDVVVLSPYLLNIVKKEGAFQKHGAPEAATYPKELQFDPDGVISPFITLRPVGIVFNTKLLKPEDAPRSLKDLLDPKWKGKIVIPDPAQHATTVDWLASLRRIFANDAEWEAWIRGLAKNAPRLVKSFIPAVETVIKGEKPIAITYVRYVFVYGTAPLDYVRISPSLGNVNSLAMGAKVAHPNAAKLFISFMLSRVALETLASGGENVALAGVYPKIKDIEKIQVTPLAELSAEEFQKWAQTFNEWLTKG